MINSIEDSNGLDINVTDIAHDNDNVLHINVIDVILLLRIKEFKYQDLIVKLY